MTDQALEIPALRELFINLTPRQLALTAAILLIASFLISRYQTWRQNPLNRFPGPFSAHFSNALYSWNFMTGRRPWKELELHERYGPVVRVAPNEVCFCTSASWRDIYGPRKGHQTFVKSPFYEGGNFGAEAASIVSVRDPAEHKKMRGYLASAFSDQSLKAQESLISGIVDNFIHKIGEKGQTAMGVDMTLWFNLATFDIIGSLAFGQDFGGVTSGAHHFWCSIVVKSLGLGALADCFTRFPWVSNLVQTLFPSLLNKVIADTRKHEAYTMDLVKRRLAAPSDRPDFLTKMIENRESEGISDIQLAAHSSDFVIAGSETTATTLACATYYLQQNPPILAKLRQEVRSSFSRYEDINMNTAAKLPYLRAVALEAMRVYPPLPFSLPRVVPKGGDTIDGHFLPGGTIVTTSPYAASMYSKNWNKPSEFCPERWLGENPTDDLEATQPFSYGTRSCMGRSLGWMELNTILAKLHYTYDMELLDGALDWQAQSRMYTLWEKPALMVKIKPRQL